MVAKDGGVQLLHFPGVWAPTLCPGGCLASCTQPVFSTGVSPTAPGPGPRTETPALNGNGQSFSSFFELWETLMELLGGLLTPDKPR